MNNNENVLTPATYYMIDEETRANLEADLALCLATIGMKYNMTDKRDLMLYTCDLCMPIIEEGTDNPYWELLSKIINNEDLIKRHFSKIQTLGDMITTILIRLEEDIEKEGLE